MSYLRRLYDQPDGEKSDAESDATKFDVSEDDESMRMNRMKEGRTAPCSSQNASTPAKAAYRANLHEKYRVLR